MQEDARLTVAEEVDPCEACAGGTTRDSPPRASTGGGSKSYLPKRGRSARKRNCGANAY